MARPKLTKGERTKRAKETARKYMRASVTAKTTKGRIYNLARARGEPVAKARKIAADLDEAVVTAHRNMMEIDKAVLIGTLRAGIADKNFTRVREATGLSLSTISRIAGGKKAKRGRVKDTSKTGRPYNPQQNTLTSIGIVLDMEIRAVPRTRGQRQKVQGMREGQRIN